MGKNIFSHMVYNNMVYKRFKKPFRKSGIKVKKTVKPTGAAMATITTRLKRLEVKDRRNAVYLNYGQWSKNVSVSDPCYIVPLNTYSGMDRIFGSSADDEANNAIIHKSVGIQWRVSLENPINNEEDTTGFSLYIVSLRDNANNYFTPSSGALNISAGTAGTTHYATAGYTMVNKKMFKIHYFKTFSLTNFASALGTSSAGGKAFKEGYIKLRMNNLIRNPAGNWRALNSALDPSKQYYMLVFNDNNSADTESPTLTYNAIHTFKTIA